MVIKGDNLYTNRKTNVWFCTKCSASILPFNNIDDDTEYLETIYEWQSSELQIPFNLLVSEDRIFSPFSLNEDVTMPLGDTDPDIQFYNSQCNRYLHSCD